MRVSFHAQPAYSMAVCYLDYGESMRAESGAMATMSDSIDVSADSGPGGVVKGLIRKQLGGESFFMGRYTAHMQDAWVAVAPKKPGDIIAIEVRHGAPGLVAEAGSLLAMGEGVNVDVRWAGVRNILLREGATMLHLDGEGTALLCTYGGFVKHHLEAGQGMIVDTGHLVAYEDTCSVKVGMLGGMTTAAFSGEGLVAQIKGPGAVYVQTRAEAELKNWLFPERSQNG
jgi:uncharacterized protein (TIGR00266 family)